MGLLRMIGIGFIVWTALLVHLPAHAQDQGRDHNRQQTLTIGYLQLKGDDRYADERVADHYQAQPWGRPYPGARVALKESRFAGAAVGLAFALKRKAVVDIDALEQAVKAFDKQGIHMVLLDLPGDTVAELARRTRQHDVLLFNISALDNALRQDQCQSNLMHTAPSRAMLMDGLGQFLVFHKWRKVLALKGPRPADAAMLQSFARSAKRYGIEISETRDFKLGQDPRHRGRNNVALLTSGADYDVVFVADTDGEFARAVPYEIQKPRPVVGGAGLVADWWHWSFERYGARQLNHRFMRQAARPMTGYDWSAWIAVKSIVAAAVRTKSTDYRKMVDYIQGPKLDLDGFKGARLSYRDWDNQLRQPILLSTYNWVTASAPFKGFLHATNDLDTLGFARQDSSCAIAQGQ